MLAKPDRSADLFYSLTLSVISRAEQQHRLGQSKILARFIALVALLGSLSPAPAGATDFTVQTSVFIGDAETPVEQRVTVFKANKVYDFTKGRSGNAYMLDSVSGDLAMLDEETRTSAKISVNELVRFVAEQRIRMDKMPEALRAKLVPRLVADWNPTTMWLRLESHDFGYSAKLQDASTLGGSLATGQGSAAASTIARDYRRFTDTLARLNSIRPPAMPPQSRLRLNAEIAERDSVPTEIIRKSGTQVTRSMHGFHLATNDQDKQRCRAIVDAISNGESIALRDFLSR